MNVVTVHMRSSNVQVRNGAHGLVHTIHMIDPTLLHCEYS